MNYLDDICKRIVESYNRQPDKLSFGISTNSISTEYYTGEKDGLQSLDFDSFAAINRTIEEGIARGQFTSKKDNKLGIYKRITASAEQVGDMAKYLGLDLKPEYLVRLKQILCAFEHSSCLQVNAWVKQQLSSDGLGDASSWFKFSSHQRDNQASEISLQKLLEACEAASRLNEDVLLRNFSSSFLIGSKSLERTFKEKLAKIMAPEMAADNIPSDEILKTLHILKNPASIWIKGNGVIYFKNGDRITCSAFSSSIALSRDYVAEIERIEASSVLTIENLTTFNDYPTNEESLIVFTSGYANSLVVSFLKKCTKDNRLHEIRHFGDLDGYGFDIIRDLAERTGVKVRPFMMDIEIYDQCKRWAIDLTASNRMMLNKLIQSPYFSGSEKALFQTFLTDKKTLEQECINLTIHHRSTNREERGVLV